MIPIIPMPDETVADCAKQWLETIEAETRRDEPDLPGRVRQLVRVAMRHVQICELLNDMKPTP
jgi:hypothetical protein